MAAAYAALVSLLNTMDQIHFHPLLSTCFHNYPKESLCEKIDFLLDFVENYSYADITEAEDLARQIAVVAHEAEDLIEVEAADRIRGESSTVTSLRFLSDLQKRIEDMDSITEKVIKVKEETTGFITGQPTSSIPPPSSSAPPATTTVGFDGYVVQLLDKLTGQHSDRQIIPIVGMGGIGKTTLARNVYENLLTVHHFDVRAWVVVSQEFNAREVLLQAFSCLGRSSSKMDRTDDQVGEELYKILCGRRYLIILDDMWSVVAWEKIMFFFPENINGSRIVITTRQSELVDYFGFSALAVKFLDDKNSWELFCEKTFAQQGCPHLELEQVGKKIVKKCRGLPLAIIMIGGLLRKSSRTLEYWERIAKDKNLILDSGEDNKMSCILYLSYKNLPVWLKSCFLYLGLFPEDHEIEVSELVKIWVAEGFIRSKTEQSLEEIAEGYTKELVDRNLLLVGRLGLDKKLESCRVHDVVRELCIRIAEKENYFCVQRDIDDMHHFIVDGRTARFYPCNFETPPSIVCPLILEAYREKSLNSRLLRVLFSNGENKHLHCNFREVNLRFLFHEGHVTVNTYRLPSSISLLWSLQTLIVRGVYRVVAPSEIWMMPQLRHIKIRLLCLPDPPFSDEILVLENLQTLERVQNLILTEEACKRIANIKELHIHYEFDGFGAASSCYHLHNVGSLDKLEKLQYVCMGWKYAGDSLQNLKLPSSLKELSLYNSRLVWSDMAMIASLPHLQILKLENNAVVGREWNISAEEEFTCLKRLIIHGCDDLIHWNIAGSSNFPVLETLYLESLWILEEIPSGIGEISTLERIRMYKCSESATISAAKILEEQECLGNEGLQLALHFDYKTEVEMWRKKIEQLGFICHNLHYYSTTKLDSDYLQF